MSAGTLYLVPTPLAADAADASVPVPVRGRIHRIGYFIVEEPKSARAFLKVLEHPRTLVGPARTERHVPGRQAQAIEHAEDAFARSRR